MSDKVGGGGDQKVVGAAGPGALALAVVSQRAGVVRRVPVARECVCVIVCVRERESVCVREKEERGRERESVCVSVRERECVCEREKESVCERQ